MEQIIIYVKIIIVHVYQMEQIVYHKQNVNIIQINMHVHILE